MTSGLHETHGYDPNGSLTRVSIYGGVNGQSYDDEDRLTSFTTSAGVTDSFVYNGLGLRVDKTDSTGTYAYLCDGASPGSPVLSDGHAVYTPGLSESRAGVSSYYDFDRLGNLWTVDPATGKGQAYYQDTTGFGTVTSAGGGSASPFKFGGGNGCQTDADAGLVLMGYRYLDTRTGRFLTQDPKGAGTNWYAYAGNNPVNQTDPMGLSTGLPGTVGAPDERYGGLGGFLGSDAGGLFGGESNLDDFFAGEDDSILRGEAGYIDGEIAKAKAALEAALAEKNAASTDDSSSGQGLGEDLNGQEIALGVAPKKNPNYVQKYDDWEIFHWKNLVFSWQNQYDIAEQQAINGGMLGGTGTMGTSGISIYSQVLNGAKANPETMEPAWILQFGGAGLYVYGRLRMNYLLNHKY